MPALISSSATIAEWQALLDGIDVAVSSALAEMDRREQALGDGPEQASPEYPEPGALEERLAGVEARFDKARSVGAIIETLLALNERGVSEWRLAANAARQRLDAAERL